MNPTPHACRAGNRRWGLPSGDQGVAMIFVLGVALVVAAMVTATLAYTVNGVRSARGDQDWQAALPAAEAGVDHYLSRLNDDDAYLGFGNPADPFSAGSAALLTLPTGAKANPAFTTWTEVPGSQGRASFRYAVDTSAFLTTGVIRLQSTGRVGQRTRTVESAIGRRNFLDYLWFTNLEIVNPALYSPAAYPACSRPLYVKNTAGQIRFDQGWNDVATRDSGCTPINFATIDTLNGPVHSNDAMYVCGQPTFNSDASTSYDGALTGGRRYVRNLTCSGNTPRIASSGNNFAYQAPLSLPPDNTKLSHQASASLTAPATPGCLYTGPTEIVLRADGRMDVTSPWSKNGGAAWCGTGTGLARPSRGVIWVQNVPADPGAAPEAAGYSRSAPALVSGATCTATTNPLGYPKRFGSGSDARTDRTPYGCRDGDAIVSGNVTGRLTIGAENNIVVADDLRYADTSCSASTTCTDVLGLVANNFVETMHPYGCRDGGGGCGNLTAAQNNLVIEAAILSVRQSFRTQNAGDGSSLGTLTVRGAIGQNYRGAVGTVDGSRGYAKNYNYDWRLRYASPPYFLDPEKSSFGPKTWAEPQAAYPASAP